MHEDRGQTTILDTLIISIHLDRFITDIIAKKPYATLDRVTRFEKKVCKLSFIWTFIILLCDPLVFCAHAQSSILFTGLLQSQLVAWHIPEAFKSAISYHTFPTRKVVCAWSDKQFTQETRNISFPTSASGRGTCSLNTKVML